MKPWETIYGHFRYKFRILLRIISFCRQTLRRHHWKMSFNVFLFENDKYLYYIFTVLTLETYYEEEASR